MKLQNFPQTQRGVALIIALILVALAAILATKLSFDGFVEQRRTVTVLAAEQAWQFSMGAEALAADVLTQNRTNSSQDTLADAWAQPTQPLPITPEENPDGEPIGTMQGALEDMQGRFNLNSLGHNQNATTSSAGTTASVASTTAATSASLGAASTLNETPDPIPLAIFQRLLVSVGLEPKWAAQLRDWIDADDQPMSQDGAEDSVYTLQTPPYRAANYPLESPSELMNLPGFGADRYRKIAPYVTALPTATLMINLCTAPGVVLDSLNPKGGSEFGNQQVLDSERKTGCFPDQNAVTAAFGGQSSQITPYISTSSAYFMLTTRVALGTSEFTLYSLLYRSSAKVAPIMRYFGTY